MVRFIHILLVFLLLLSASFASAQTPPTCGIVEVNGPAQVEAGEAVVFVVKTTSMLHTTSPRFNWTVSAGTITSGQGTASISVDSTGLGGAELIATAELVGAPPGCRASASATTKVPAVFVCGHRFDEYGDIRFEDEKARLDSFAIQLLNDPESSGLIMMEAGQVTFENEASERLDRAKSYLVNVREIDPTRITTVDCGFAPDLNVRLYIVPLGVTAPECRSIFEAPLSVKFTKRRPKTSKRKN